MNGYKPKLKFWRKQTIKRLFLVILTLFLIFIAGVLGAFAYFSKDLPNPDRLKEREVIQSTRIYDRTGEILLYDIHNLKKRSLVELDEIPAYIQWAAIAAEDENFWHHHGFDVKGIIRAFWANLKEKKITQGGSTITQQLVKNAILTPDRTLTRKIKEVILSIEIERKFSKNEILQMYLNEIPYGSNIYGIEAASQSFFNKPSYDLTLSEAALLSALPKAPSWYSPYGIHTKELYSRHMGILSQMLNLGYISKEDYESALEQELKFASPNPIKAPHFVMFVRELLIEKFGERVVEEGGLRVITSIDMELQQLAEDIIKEESAKNLSQYGAKNASLVAINPNTGEILAMIGSRDYFDLENDGNVNVATRLRQPGSSIKPFVYATAFKKGYTPNTMVFDLETNFETREEEEYIPQNYDNKFRGPVTFRQGIAMSLNLPSVKVLYLAGVKDSTETAKDMGITTLTDPNRYGLSLVLGGGEVKLLEETSAYGVFATEGIRFPYESILKISNSQGEALEEFKPKGKRVLEENIARIVTDVLSDNEARTPMFGANSNLYLGARPAAAKTGTTSEYRDGWTLGYTPQLVVGVWVGNNDNTPMKNKASGGRVAAPIWNRFMKEALEGKEILEFNEPIEIEEEPIKQIKKVKIDKITGKLATDLTPPHLVEEKIFQEVHSILYYINPTDEQFVNWELPVLTWANEHNYNAAIPVEYDDVHSKNNQPIIRITKLSTQNELLEIQADIQANLQLKQVDFLFNGQLMATDKTAPYAALFTMPTNTPGSHIITVRAYDNVDNVGEKSESISLP